MAITLSPEIERKVEDLKTLGEFADVDDLLLSALELLDHNVRLSILRAKLRPAVDEFDRGGGVEYSDAVRVEIRRRAETRLLAGDKPNPDVCE